MSRFFKKGSILLVLTFLGIVFVISCQGGRVVVEKGPMNEHGASGPASSQGPPPWAPAHGYRAKHTYRYYPSSRVYYDTGRGIYFYFSSGDWRVSVSLPDGIHIDANHYVMLEMDSDTPYAYHSAVEKKYPPGQTKKKK